MKQDKEYFKKYYKDHKKEYLERSKEWCKNNPGKRREIIKRHHKKLGRKEPENKTDYGKIGLRALYIKYYGKDLENRVDDITHLKCKERRFCLDCPIHNKVKCPGWEECIHKKETLEFVNKEEAE